MFVTRFDFDAKTDKTLEKLRQHYGSSSKAAVLRKAIALLCVAKRYESPEGTLTLRRQDGNDITIVVR